jgi:hypothetical protein
MSNEANIIITPSNNFILQDTIQGDLLCYTGTSNQNICMGLYNKVSSLKLTSCNTIVKGSMGLRKTPNYALDVTGNVNIQGNLLQNGQIFQNQSRPAFETDNGNSTLCNQIPMSILSGERHTYLNFIYNSGNSTNIYTYETCLDPNNNMIVCGSLYNAFLRNQDGTTPSNIPYMLSNPFNINARAGYIVSYSSTGNVNWHSLLYMNSINDMSVNSVCSDTLGNVYATGFYTGAQMSITINGVFQQTIAGSGDRCFLIKYSSNGSLVWVSRLATDNTFGISVTTDSSNNVYLGGYFSTNPTIFNNKTDSESYRLNGVYSSANSFIAKYTSNSDIIWAAKIEACPLYDNNFNIKLAVDSSNNVYAFGNGNSTFYVCNAGSNVIGTNVSMSGNGLCLVKYNGQTGSNIWYTKFNAVSKPYSGGITIDSSNNIYVSGSTNASHSNFHAGTAVAINNFPLTKISPNYEGFVSKYDINGSNLLSIRIDDGNNNYCYGMACDSSNNLYVAGYYSYNANSTNYSKYFTYSNNSQVYTGNLVTGGQVSSNIALNVNLPFLLQFSSNGQLQYDRCLISSSNNSSYSGTSYKVVINKYNSAFVVGSYVGPDAYFYNIPTASWSNIPIYNTNNYSGFIYHTNSNTYRLINNLNNSNNGLNKYIANYSPFPLAVQLRNSANTSTLSNFNLLPNQVYQFLWYSNQWYPLQQNFYL